MSRKPWSLKLRAAYSMTFSNVASGIVMVPGNRMCATGGSTLPSGTYASVGATSALPRATAIFSDSALTRTLCLPSTMCGPFCSVPPIGRMTVVLPAATWSRSSVQVRSSTNTVGGGAASAPDAASIRAHARRRDAMKIMSAHYDGRRAPGPCGIRARPQRRSAPSSPGPSFIPLWSLTGTRALRSRRFSISTPTANAMAK